MKNATATHNIAARTLAFFDLDCQDAAYAARRSGLDDAANLLVKADSDKDLFLGLVVLSAELG